MGLLCLRSWSQWKFKMSVDVWMMVMFVQMISSKPPNILFSNLVLCCIIMRQSVMQTDWFAFFKVKVTARAHMIKIWQFLLYLLNCSSVCHQTWFDSTLSYHKPECFMEKLDCCVQGQGHSKISKCQWIFVQMIFSESLNLFATKLDVVMHHYEPHCLSKKIGLLSSRSRSQLRII